MLKGRRVAVGPGPVWLAAFWLLACCQISSTGVLAAECTSGLAGPACGGTHVKGWPAAVRRSAAVRPLHWCEKGRTSDAAVWRGAQVG